MSYSKAPLVGRFGAFFSDMMIAGALMPLAIPLVYAGAIKGTVPTLGVIAMIIGATWQIFYFLVRDGISGAGFGKRITGQIVVTIETGMPIGVGASIVRQLVFFLLNIVPLVGGLIEPVMVLVDKEGRRLGDRAAKTQVVTASEATAHGIATPGKKGGAWAALSIALAITLLGGAYGAYTFVQAVNATTSRDGDTGSVILDPDTGQNADTTEKDRTPEQVIDDFYRAAASSDFNEAALLFSAETLKYISPNLFDGWEPPSYQILSTDTTEPGYAYVKVQEYEGGFSGGIVTYVLVEEDGAWKIDDWMSGGIGDETSGEDPDEDPYASRLDPETATAAVKTLLTALQNDDMPGMRDATSDYFESNNPDFFAPSAGAFADFEVLDVFEDGATYIVIVREEWVSGPEEMTYIVVEEAYIAVVDEVYYE